MKHIASHRVVNGNESTDVHVFRTRDGRGHRVVFGTGGAVAIPFHHGDPNAGLNGLTLESLLEVVRDKLEQHQAGPYPCDENARALEFVVAARHALDARTDRLDREEYAPAPEDDELPPLDIVDDRTGDEPTVDLADDPDDKPF